MKVEFNLAKLVETAKSRWFKTVEIFQILKSLEESNLKSVVLDKLPERPIIGSFFLIAADKSNKKWKQDGYSYVKRNNGVGFREDVVYLKIASVKEIMCSYSYLDHNLTETTNLPSCRRIYKLVNATGAITYYLIHYLNEKSLNEGSTDKNSEILTSDTINSAFSTSDDVLSGKQFEEETTFTSPNLADYLEKITDSDVLEPAENREEKAMNFISYFELNDTEFIPQNLFGDLENKFTDIPSFTGSLVPSNPQQEGSPSLEPANFSLQNKFTEIENRLTTLENEKPAPVFHPINFPNYEKDNVFNIVDYSPEWDFTKGGAKVIICVSPLCFVAEAINEKLKVYFGEIAVPGYFIQPGVLKCYAPPHCEGFVKLSLRISGEVVSSNQSHALFEYRKERKHRGALKAGAVQSDMGAIGEFKVRVVQKTREYDNLFGPSLQNGRDTEHEQVFRKYSEMKLDDINDFNTFLPESDLLKIFQFMIANNPKGKEKEFIDYLDEIDRYGYALIHYICYLQYNSCLEFILKNGSSPNVTSTSGVTPLEISLKYKNEKMLELLLTKGALGPKKVEEAIRRTCTDMPQNALDIASLYKDRKLLDMLLREVSLLDSINNSLSAAYPEGDDASDDSYLSLHDFLEDEFNNLNPRDFQFKKRRGCDQSDYDRADGPARAEDIKGRNQTKRPRKYFRNYDKKVLPQKENRNENQKAKIDPVIAADHQNEVKVIQKNVRAWLLRRQYLDILHATRVLQNYMRGKTAKKKPNGEEEAWEETFEDKLKNKVKDLLDIMEKCSVSIADYLKEISTFTESKYTL